MFIEFHVILHDDPMELLKYCLPHSFEGAGFSLAKTQAILNAVASNCVVEEGEVTNAVEVFWTPGDPKETLTSRDCIVDFPELVDL